MRKGLILALFACLIAAAALTSRHWAPLQLQEGLGLHADISEIRAHQTPRLTAALASEGLEFGAPVFVRIFKEEGELELFVKRGPRYALFRTYPICNYSGDLGPKLREGDRQSPEGVYNVGLSALNPSSRYHLSFNLGFPNAFDRGHGRTGSFLMVHGDCVSIGCYAMTDLAIEEIYVLIEAALRKGQESVTVYALPFRPTAERMALAADSEWYDFWTDLARYNGLFEKTGNPVAMRIANGRYVVRTPPPSLY